VAQNLPLFTETSVGPPLTANPSSSTHLHRTIMNRAVTFAGRAAAARALSTSASAGASNGAAASAHWALAATLAAGASVLAMDSKASCAADVTT